MRYPNLCLGISSAPSNKGSDPNGGIDNTLRPRINSCGETLDKGKISRQERKILGKIHIMLINHVNMYNSEAFSPFTRCNHHLCLVLGHFHHPSRRPHTH